MELRGRQANGTGRPTPWLVVLVFGVIATGCGAGFDPPSELKSLRVLGVQKSQPYAAPGEQVELSMLWHDPGGGSEPPATVAWLSATCTNPAGDVYYSCFDRVRAAGEPLGLVEGDHFSLRVPPDVLSSRPEPPPRQPRYGLVLAFFGLCRGTFELFPEAEPGAFPVVCRGPTGELVAPDQFVAGYTAVHVFADLSEPGRAVRNRNPVLGGLEVGGAAVPSCVGEKVDPSSSESCATSSVGADAEDFLDCDDEDSEARCFDGCPDDGRSDCPGIAIRPVVEPEAAERDEIALVAYGRDSGEQMWIDYYVDRGSTRSAVRLLNDATSGWNASFGTEFLAPAEAGLVTLWAVVHDNRGGMNWVRAQIGIRTPRE